MMNLLLIAMLAFQTPPVANPSGVAFTSPDHETVENGVAVVSRYILEVLPSNGTTVVATRDIGKPALVSGEVVTNQLASIRTTLTPGSYVVRVVAEGPGGRATSVNSDPFTVTVRVPTAPSKPVIQQ